MFCYCWFCLGSVQHGLVQRPGSPPLPSVPQYKWWNPHQGCFCILRLCLPETTVGWVSQRKKMVKPWKSHSPIAHLSSRKQPQWIGASNRSCFFMQWSRFVVKASLGLRVSPKGAGNGEYWEQGTSQAWIFLLFTSLLSTLSWSLIFL